MTCFTRTSVEQTVALQSFANLSPGDRYYVETEDGGDFLGFLKLERGPFMSFLVGEQELNVGPLDIKWIQRM